MEKKLVIILVGGDGPSVLYVKRKLFKASENGIETELIKFEEDCTDLQLISRIQELNKDESVGGIMVQLPLPGKSKDQSREILDVIDPKKDVDCLTSANLQLVKAGNPRFYPAATKAVLEILGEQLNKKLVFAEGTARLKNKNCVVVGASDLVGKPVAMVFRNMGGNVRVCDEFTPKDELHKTCLKADILVSATGVPHLIRKDMVKPGAIVIDVGIARDENGKLVGDVDFEEVSKVAAFVSPVPGGVGPRTVEALLDNFQLSC